MGLTAGQHKTKEEILMAGKYERRLNFINNQGNAKQNHNKISLHMRQAKTKSSENIVSKNLEQQELW